MEVLMGKPWENYRKMKVYPLVNVYITMENPPFSMDKSTISMVIFKFPEYIFQSMIISMCLR